MTFDASNLFRRRRVLRAERKCRREEKRGKRIGEERENRIEGAS